MTPVEHKQLFLQLRHVRLLKVYLVETIAEQHKILEQSHDLHHITRAQGQIALAKKMIGEIEAAESAA